MKLRHVSYLVTSILILCFFSSCNIVSSSDIGGGLKGTEGTNAYPFEIEETISFSNNDSSTSYPFEDPIDATEVFNDEEVQPQIIFTQNPPNSQEDLGIVYGTLISLTDGSMISQVTLIAAEKVYLDNSEGYVITFREKSSPRGETNEFGQFVIDSISPGEYVLMLVTPGGSYLALDKDLEEIHLVIEPNSVSNLGDVLISWP